LQIAHQRGECRALLVRQVFARCSRHQGHYTDDIPCTFAP
jgi:hypothetical protein